VRGLRWHDPAGLTRVLETHRGFCSLPYLARPCYTHAVAIITVPVLLTTMVAVHYIRRRNRQRALAAGGAQFVEELDTSVVAATIVLTSLPGQVMERTLELLPPNMSRSIVLVLGELPPIAHTTVEKERNRWLSHFDPPRADMADIESEDPRHVAAATVRLVLEDAT
jgi:heme/copper-type cytochrome/quinol oxidase subunit 2